MSNFEDLCIEMMEKMEHGEWDMLSNNNIYEHFQKNKKVFFQGHRHQSIIGDVSLAT